MAYENDRPRIATAVLTGVSTAAMVWLGTGLEPWWPLLWFAPLPVLAFAMRSSNRTAALTGFLSWLAGSLSMWPYYQSSLHSPPILLASLLTFLSVVPALMFMACVLLFRALLLRGAYWYAMLAPPSAWVSYEYILNVLWPHGTGGSLSYTQLNFLPFLQVASLTGPWGMTFLLLLFPAMITTALFLRQTNRKRVVRIIATGAAIFGCVMLFGAVRLGRQSQTQTVKAGLIASDQPDNVDVADEGAKTELLLGEYFAVAEDLAARGAKVIVLPEKLGVMIGTGTQATDPMFQRLADKTGASIVIGVLQVSPPLKYNQARVFVPSAPMLTYDKHHLLPPFESKLKPGTTLTTVSESSGTWGIAICKDLDFTPLSRQYGQAQTALMLVPAWDFGIDRVWHGHIAIMRGVEDGFSVVRAAKQGFLTVSDDRGRVLAETRSDSAPFATLLTNVPVGHDATLYLLLGDWFAWFALATFAVALVTLYRLRKTKRLAIPVD